MDQKDGSSWPAFGRPPMASDGKYVPAGPSLIAVKLSDTVSRNVNRNWLTNLPPKTEFNPEVVAIDHVVVASMTPRS